MSERRTTVTEVFHSVPKAAKKKEPLNVEMLIAVPAALFFIAMYAANAVDAVSHEWKALQQRIEAAEKPGLEPSPRGRPVAY